MFFGKFLKMFRGSRGPDAAGEGKRAVPGALVVGTAEGGVIYNLLTPHMQQFMGRCIGTLKRAGIRAKGTGQFSVLIGKRERELRLDRFYQPVDDPAMIEKVVAEAREIVARKI
jgi:hypothetical protein